MSYSDTCEYCGNALCTQCGQHMTASIDRATYIDRANAFERALKEIASGSGVAAEIARKELDAAEATARVIADIR